MGAQRWLTCSSTNDFRVSGSEVFIVLMPVRQMIWQTFGKTTTPELGVSRPMEFHSVERIAPKPDGIRTIRIGISETPE